MTDHQVTIVRLTESGIARDGSAAYMVADLANGSTMRIIVDAGNLARFILDFQTQAGRLRKYRESLGDPDADRAAGNADSLLPVKAVEFLHDREHPGDRILRCLLPSGEGVSLRFPREMVSAIGAAFSSPPTSDH